MRSSRATAALALAGAIILAACADDGEPRDPEPTWTPTSVPESPSTSAAATPTPPALPDAAKKATPAGAEAFIRHYFDLIHYAELTGDVAPLRKVSGAKCDGCNDGIDGLRQHYKEGGSVSGGGYRIEVDALEEIDVEEDAAFGFGAELTAFAAAQTIIGADGATEETKNASREWAAVVVWVGNDHWQLDVLELV